MQMTTTSTADLFSSSSSSSSPSSSSRNDDDDNNNNIHENNQSNNSIRSTRMMMRDGNIVTTNLIASVGDFSYNNSPMISSNDDYDQQQQQVFANITHLEGLLGESDAQKQEMDTHMETAKAQLASGIPINSSSSMDWATDSPPLEYYYKRRKDVSTTLFTTENDGHHILSSHNTIMELCGGMYVNVTAVDDGGSSMPLCSILERLLHNNIDSSNIALLNRKNNNAFTDHEILNNMKLVSEKVVWMKMTPPNMKMFRNKLAELERAFCISNKNHPKAAFIMVVIGDEDDADEQTTFHHAVVKHVQDLYQAGALKDWNILNHVPVFVMFKPSRTKILSENSLPTTTMTTTKVPVPTNLLHVSKVKPTTNNNNAKSPMDGLNNTLLQWRITMRKIGKQNAEMGKQLEELHKQIVEAHNQLKMTIRTGHDDEPL